MARPTGSPGETPVSPPVRPCSCPGPDNLLPQQGLYCGSHPFFFRCKSCNLTRVLTWRVWFFLQPVCGVEAGVERVTHRRRGTVAGGVSPSASPCWKTDTSFVLMSFYCVYERIIWRVWPWRRCGSGFSGSERRQRSSSSLPHFKNWW